ncbi:MAG: 3-deoxy-D-manno-octulosonic acid transferase [Phycisphaerae bacterium]
MILLLDAAYFLALLLLWPWLLYRRWKAGPGSLSISERLGKLPSRPVAAHCVWIHGVSLGEINATRTIVAELRRRSPDTAIYITSTTRTGLDRARELYPHLPVGRFPVDLSFAIRRALGVVRPTAIILMELETWPNLLFVAARAEIPVLIANGRVTEERSMRRFRRWPLRGLARRMFREVRWVGAQDATYAARFVELGAPAERVEVTGSVKYDSADVADHIDGMEALADAMAIDRMRPLWVCGSTGPDEEAAILAAYSALRAEFPALQLALIPRKPERFEEVARLIVRHGYACLRRSAGPPLVPESVAEPTPVFLGDSVGELRKFYALATVVFVGRTLVPLGGSDVMEVAGLAKPMIVGPFVENFAEAIELLRAERGVVEVASVAELAPAVARLLGHATERERIGRAARRTIVARRGATERIIDRVLRELY